MYDAYDQNLLMIQRIEERKIKSLFTDNLASLPLSGNTLKKQQQDSCYIHKERAVLDIRLTNIIQLDLCQFHYIEVPLYGHKKPLVIHFQFSDAAKMKFYISSHTLTPNRFNNEEAFERKQILRYTEQGEHTSFSQRCLYLAIFSQQATTISAKASFGIKPQTLFKTETESRIRPSTGYQFTASQFFETRRPSKDLVQLNKNVQQYEPETFRKQQMLRRVQSAQKISETLRKKKIIQAEKKDTIREKFEYQEKRKIIKEILSVRNHINHFVKFQQKVWLINLYMIQSVTLIKNLFYDNIRAKFTASIKKRRQYRAKQALRKMLEKQGKNIYQRTIFVGLMNLRMLAKLKAPKSKQKAKRIVHSFMMSYGQIGEIFQKTYQFKRRMKRVIEVYRNYRKKVLAYTNRIIMLWNKYWNQIYMDIKHEDQEKVTEIKKQMAKTIINYHVDEEIVKSPYLDIKVQATITNQYYKEIRNIFIRKWRLFKIKLKATRSSIIAAQAFDRKQEVLFAIVDKSVLKSLIYKYMQEKGMIQSLLLKKN